MSRPAGYILRIRDANGMKRIEPTNGASCTLGTLKKQIAAISGVNPESQLISTTPPHEPNFIVAADTATLGSLHLKHGDILYLVNIGDSDSTDTKSQKTDTGNNNNTPLSSLTIKPTANCQHGPRGRCLHCDAVPPGATPVITGKCNHVPSATCIHCSKYIKERVAESKVSLLLRIQLRSRTTLP